MARPALVLALVRCARHTGRCERRGVRRPRPGGCTRRLGPGTRQALSAWLRCLGDFGRAAAVSRMDDPGLPIKFGPCSNGRVRAGAADGGRAGGDQASPARLRGERGRARRDARGVPALRVRRSDDAARPAGVPEGRGQARRRPVGRASGGRARARRGARRAGRRGVRTSMSRATCSSTARCRGARASRSSAPSSRR